METAENLTTCVSSDGTKHTLRPILQVYLTDTDDEIVCMDYKSELNTGEQYGFFNIKNGRTLYETMRSLIDQLEKQDKRRQDSILNPDKPWYYDLLERENKLKETNERINTI